LSVLYLSKNRSKYYFGHHCCIWSMPIPLVPSYDCCWSQNIRLSTVIIATTATMSNRTAKPTGVHSVESTTIVSCEPYSYNTHTDICIYNYILYICIYNYILYICIYNYIYNYILYIYMFWSVLIYPPLSTNIDVEKKHRVDHFPRDGLPGLPLRGPGCGKWWNPVDLHRASESIWWNPSNCKGIRWRRLPISSRHAVFIYIYLSLSV